MVELRSVEQAGHLIAESSKRPVLLLKHSTRCGISAYADGQFRMFQEEHADPPVTCARVLVVEERAVSMWLAERLGVPHASPQIMLIAGGNVVWHASHYSVNEKNIEEAMNRTTGKEA